MKILDKWHSLIVHAAESFRLDANLIRAIIMVESSGIPDSVRFESHWRLFNNPQAFSERVGITRQEEERAQATSWGLMQVMGAVARDLGFTDNLEMLLIPKIGIFYGCKKLRQLTVRYGDEAEDKIIAAYNQGNARTDQSGMFMNQRYVDKVYAILREVRTLS